MSINESPTKRANRLKREIISKDIKKFSTLNSIELSNKLGLSYSKVRSISKEFGIELPRVKLDNYLQKAVIKYITKNPEVKYEIVANRFGTSKSYIGRIARANKISKNKTKEDKDKIKNAIAHINLDFDLGMSYEYIREKYDLDSNIVDLTYYGLKNLGNRYRVLRDKEISEQYKVKTAIKVMTDANTKLDNPNRVKTLSGTYGVACKDGFKKYPKIGNRNNGGTFEDKKILRYIEKLRDKDGLTFQEIADKLTRQGKKTLTGVPFSMANALYKYNAYKKNKYKRLKY